VKVVAIREPFAVVHRRVDDDLRPAPGSSLVVRHHQVNAAEGADMLLASAGANDEEVAVAAAAERGPAVVILGFPTDNLRFQNVRPGRRGGSVAKPKAESGGCETGGAEKSATIHTLIH
jgi:hypothetical protein